jgi:hypothetical protein
MPSFGIDYPSYSSLRLCDKKVWSSEEIKIKN